MRAALLARPPTADELGDGLRGPNGAPGTSCTQLPVSMGELTMASNSAWVMYLGT